MELRREKSIRRILMLRAAYEAGFVTGEYALIVRCAAASARPPCPFDSGTPEFDEWKKGYEVALEEGSIAL